MNNTDWKKYYKEHSVSVEEAVQHIKSGDLIMDGHGCGRSDIFHEALMKRADAGELEDVRLSTGWNMGSSDYLDPKYDGKLNHITTFLIPATKNAYYENRAKYYPVPFSQQDRAVKLWAPDVLFTQVTPPNEDGYVSMGVSVDFTRNCVDVAKLVIAQVNPNMPWTFGDGIVHVSEIDYFVEAETEIPVVPEASKISDIDRAIADNVASIVKDGDTLQIGVGNVPDTVLGLLVNHKHLGVHTELGTTGIMKLMKKGVIDNSMKTLDPGKVVCTLLGGTKEFYDFVDHNEDFFMRKCEYVLNPSIIAQQKNMVSINAAVQVDLYGQACSEMLNGKQISGIGGQNDFLRGAMLSEGGRSILCMPSTAAKGTKSRIVAGLEKGTVVSDTRYDTMFIVTEYGVADLWGRSLNERARALIEIAHPDFRAELEKEFYEMTGLIV